MQNKRNAMAVFVMCSNNAPLLVFKVTQSEVIFITVDGIILKKQDGYFRGSPTLLITSIIRLVQREGRRDHAQLFPSPCGSWTNLA